MWNKPRRELATVTNGSCGHHICGHDPANRSARAAGTSSVLIWLPKKRDGKTPCKTNTRKTHLHQVNLERILSSGYVVGMHLVEESLGSNQKSVSKHRARMRRSEDTWKQYIRCPLVVIPHRKGANRDVWNEVDVRDEQPKQADEQRVMPANLFHVLAEESFRKQFKACLTALNYTATRVLVNTDKAIHNFLHMCDGNSLWSLIFYHKIAVHRHSRILNAADAERFHQRT